MDALRNVCFLEWARYKRKLLGAMLGFLVALLCFLVVSVVVGKVFPEFNRNYMNWPDYIKELLGLGGWSGFLWYNIWQIVAVFYPFLHIYIIMNTLAQSVQDEDRLETIVYLRNAGVNRMTVMGAKLLFWISCSFFVALVQCSVLVFLANLTGIGVVSWLLFRYYAVLFLVSVFFIGIALNTAAGTKNSQQCEDTHLSLLVVPWLIAKIPDVIRMFAKLLEITGRGEHIVVSVEVWEQRTSFLRYVSPVMWCVPKVQEAPAGMVCGYLLIAVILFLTAFYIYRKK